jgi:hypothetical protein
MGNIGHGKHWSQLQTFTRKSSCPLTCTPIFSNVQCKVISEQKLNLDDCDFQVGVRINPWPFFWMVVSAWIWFGILHTTGILG